ncbi:MAG: prepilin-type N-terminal cleavage/methylation domain-containing protein [Deltaproteobacteria bacterium]|nr:prepilin-type N-terminal cleavage/methylation domain-containing protein [Deltaproteobacteria bacterium]MBW2421692.1 prepilin-type N-terminal cleavage/methylation domain-containing protein [Deltaproteobacteria bacterium]
MKIEMKPAMKAEVKPATARDRSTAFTLLEVLAAVAILGIWYTVIATGALRGLRSEGENLRQIRASLVADEQLAQIESALIMADPLELTDEEIEEEDLIIRIAISEFVAEGEESVGGLAGLIAAEQEAGLQFLRTIRVEVAWQEGVEEHSVVRETFAFDREAWRRFIESKGASLDVGALQQGNEDGQEANGEDEDERDEDELIDEDRP